MGGTISGSGMMSAHGQTVELKDGIVTVNGTVRARGAKVVWITDTHQLVVDGKDLGDCSPSPPSRITKVLPITKLPRLSNVDAIEVTEGDVFGGEIAVVGTNEAEVASNIATDAFNMVRMEAPKGTHLFMRTSAWANVMGDFAVSGFVGGNAFFHSVSSVQIRSVDSDVRVVRPTGRVFIHTVSGDVTIEDANKQTIEITSINGDVAVTGEVAPESALRTVHGNIVAPDGVKAVSTNGKVTRPAPPPEKRVSKRLKRAGVVSG